VPASPFRLLPSSPLPNAPPGAEHSRTEPRPSGFVKKPKMLKIDLLEGVVKCIRAPVRSRVGLPGAQLFGRSGAFRGP